jgi:glycosyltransferase involved in cell wall biosynthesis
MSLPRTLFVGKATAAVCWYRCALPAMALGQDWIGVHGDPSDLKVHTGQTAKPFEFDDLFDYEVVVLQQPEASWTTLIRRLKALGIVVLFEIDDYVQAVRKMAGHEGRHHWDKKRLAGLERNMREADGIICSTGFLARKYAAFNPNTWICRNGLDLRRYEYEPGPARPGVTVGWAGGVGHKTALGPWLPEVAAVMRARPEVRFATVGQPFARELEPEFGPERALAIPFSHLETYPASMTIFDVAIAPSGGNNLFRGKSDLRWLEASALGTPLIADPVVYPEIEPGVTGFHASSPGEMRVILESLIDDPVLRERVGSAAREHVREHRSIAAVSREWATVLEAAGAGAVTA